MQDAAGFEGQVIDNQFPLERYLGGGVRSAVFLTTYQGGPASIKFVPSGAIHLSGWEQAAQLKHPALQRIFAGGEHRLGETDCAYVVTEYADDNLAPALAEKHLTPDEAREMVAAVSGALAYLHANGWAHGHVQASNVLGIGERIALSSDCIAQQRDGAPEADCLALGKLLRQVIPSLPSPFLEIVQGATDPDPKARWTAAMIGDHLQGGMGPSAAPRTVPAFDRRWLVPAVIALAAAVAAVAWFARPSRLAEPRESLPKRAAVTQATPATSGPERVVKQVQPQIPEAALDTIKGRVRINVRVRVARTGEVESAELDPPEASKYFTDRVLTAVRQWQFVPSRAQREWILRFVLQRKEPRISVTTAPE